MIFLLGVGSTDIFSPIWKLCVINPKSQVAKQCKTASNRTAAFDLQAAEYCRQLRLLLSLAVPLVFIKMSAAAVLLPLKDLSWFCIPMRSSLGAIVTLSS